MFDAGMNAFSCSAGTRNDLAAADYFRRSAQNNCGPAEVVLGYLYDTGLIVVRDPSQAADWYRKAADSGNPLAEHNLADMYLRGDGAAQNPAEAFRLFQRAADHGHTGARIMLGSMYAEGIGTKRDLATAYMWLTAASLGGDQRGRERLVALEARLNSAQVSEARERAQQLQFGNGRQLTARALAQ